MWPGRLRYGSVDGSAPCQGCRPADQAAGDVGPRRHTYFLRKADSSIRLDPDKARAGESAENTCCQQSAPVSGHQAFPFFSGRRTGRNRRRTLLRIEPDPYAPAAAETFGEPPVRASAIDRAMISLRSDNKLKDPASPIPCVVSHRPLRYRGGNGSSGSTADNL